MEEDLTRKLKEALNQPLPGAEAHLKMASASRRKGVFINPENAKLAGVLILLYPKEAEWHLVLIERDSSNPKDKHRGQIAFPGGRIEETDDTIIDTALREAEEEVGVARESVQVIGQLSPLYIPVSNYQVFPVVGQVDYTPLFYPEEREVKAVLEVPFKLFLEAQTTKFTDITVSQQILLERVPYFDVNGKVMWGATAMIMSELITVIKQG